MGEKPDGRAIIDNVTDRLVRGGMPADKARDIAVRTRLRAEASGDAPRTAADHRRHRPEQD